MKIIIYFHVIISIFLLIRVQLIFCSSALFAENKIQVDINWPVATNQIEDKEVEGEEMFITSADKEKYKCVLPSPHAAEKMKLESYKGPTPLYLLKPLFSKIYCYFRLESYWTYELCHGHHFRQYHEETMMQGKAAQEYFLGIYEKENEKEDKLFEEEHAEKLIGKLPTVHVDDVELPYYAVNFTKGTYCALTGHDRFTRILYVCHSKGNNNIYSHKEISTCEYEVIVLTTLLCKHPAFRIDHFMETTVNCYPMPNNPPLPKSLVDLQNELDKTETFKPFPGTVVSEEPEPKKREVIADKPSYPHDQKLIDNILMGSHCLQGGSGWWRYDFCYGKEVSQFHVDASGSKTIIKLGYWDTQRHYDWLEKHPYKKPQSQHPKQVSHFYSNGDFCAEIEKPRQVEVKLKCKYIVGHPDHLSLSLLEQQTCEYILIVESPVFCTLLETVDENGLTANLKT